VPHSIFNRKRKPFPEEYRSIDHKNARLGTYEMSAVEESVPLTGILFREHYSFRLFVPPVRTLYITIKLKTDN